MKSTRYKIDLCDYCVLTQSNATNKVARQQCTICTRWGCLDNCPSLNEPRDYYTTAHLIVDVPFICSVCWTQARAIDCEQIQKGIDIHASGSSWAIRLGEYSALLMRDARDKVRQAVIIEIERLVKLGSKVEKKKQ